SHRASLLASHCSCSICLSVLLSSLIRPSPTSTLFPYTTLFRSSSKGRRELPNSNVILDGNTEGLSRDGSFVGTHIYTRIPGETRSEEHTSELQSRFDLVCRLLLEKKNETIQTLLHAQAAIITAV